MDNKITFEQALELERTATTGELCAMADQIRKQNRGQAFNTCSIINARSGRCPEDCKWCSQSAFHKTEIDIYPLIDAEEALEMARHNQSKGVRRFSLVTSGRAVSGAELDKVCAIYESLTRGTDIALCASLGLLGREDMLRLRRSGVTRYHCNLESAPSYFPSLCTTHTTAQKQQTIRWAREAGMAICSGGIIGLGETMAQRIELAVVLRDMEVESIPINFLNPIPGTALEHESRLSDDDVLRSVAMFRIVNPTAVIRLAGGRALYRHLDRALLGSGVDGAIVGDMLTTTGSDIDSDKSLFQSEGREL